MGDEALPREWVLRLNIFEASILTLIIHHSKFSNELKEVYKQLLDFQKQIEKAAGIRKELLPNGLLKLTSSDGVTIIRPPYEWEKSMVTKK